MVDDRRRFEPSQSNRAADDRRDASAVPPPHLPDFHARAFRRALPLRRLHRHLPLQRHWIQPPGKSSPQIRSIFVKFLESEA